MSKSTVVWILGVAGWLTSYAMFIRWLNANDWAFFAGWAEAFTTSDFSTGLHLDLVFVTLMMVALALWHRKKLGARWTAGVLGCLALSVSMSLAVYLVGMWRVPDESASN